MNWMYCVPCYTTWEAVMCPVWRHSGWETLRHRAHSDCAYNESVTLGIVKCEKRASIKMQREYYRVPYGRGGYLQKETLGNIISVINLSIWQTKDVCLLSFLTVVWCWIRWQSIKKSFYLLQTKISIWEKHWILSDIFGLFPCLNYFFLSWSQLLVDETFNS